MRKEPVTDKAQRTHAIDGKGKEESPLHNSGQIDAREDLRTKPGKVYEHGNRLSEGKRGGRQENPLAGEQGVTEEVDLSILCDYLFVSGLSSGQAAMAGQRDDEDSV